MIMEKDRICWTTIVNTLECLVGSSHMLIFYENTTDIREPRYGLHTGNLYGKFIRAFHMEKNFKL